ncbi:hypothetical protein OIU85_016376, partial [Salix viminalis]
ATHRLATECFDRPRREEGDEDDLGGDDDDLGDECGDLEAEIHGEESNFGKTGDDDEGERRERRLVREVFENAENEEDVEIRNNPTRRVCRHLEGLVCE